MSRGSPLGDENGPSASMGEATNSTNDASRINTQGKPVAAACCRALAGDRARRRAPGWRGYRVPYELTAGRWERLKRVLTGGDA